MKKIISVMLAVLLILAMAVPAFASETVDTSSRQSKIPVILISGDGTPVFDADGNKIIQWSDLLSSDSNDEDSEEEDNSELYQSIANVLYPFLVEGLLTGNYDNYYTNLQKEVSELFGDALLDNDGNATNGTTIGGWYQWKMWQDTVVDRKDEKGYYELGDYQFWYDWRLDPLETAEKFHDYIEAVKAVTGAEKVGIVSRCIGTSVMMAYVSKYGMDGINGIAFDGGVVNGMEIISEPFSGKLKLNGNAINRFLIDCNALGMFNVDSFLTATIDLLTKGGVFDTIAGVTKETIYYTCLEGVTSAVALSTLFTWPSYWAAVTSDDYDTAMQYIFGDEGSEKRTEYAGLIEKIENYNTQVRQNLPELFQSIKDNANICVISKYGYQMAPTCESADLVADQFASVKRSSLGATTSTIYGTLSDKYISKQEEAGLGKYISPDKQVDASTCQFADETWFVKGAKHSHWSYVENDIAYTVVSAEKQLTVDDLDWTQFIVYDNDTALASPMTEENCDTYYWTASENDDNPSNSGLRLIAFLKALFKWFTALILKIG